jgi:hypothetical protein
VVNARNYIMANDPKEYYARYNFSKAIYDSDGEPQIMVLTRFSRPVMKDGKVIETLVVSAEDFSRDLKGVKDGVRGLQGLSCQAYYAINFQQAIANPEVRERMAGITRGPSVNPSYP